MRADDPDERQVAVVSGGNRGLGLATVRRLAELGMRVVLGTRSLERGQSAVDLLGDLADHVAVRELDITDATSVDALAHWLGGRLGRCDVLVNNAATLAVGDGRAVSVDVDTVALTLDTNLLGTWRLTQAVVPLMRSRRYGRIVNVSGEAADGGFAAYRMSKYAVNRLTGMLARELAPDGILVNTCIVGHPAADAEHRPAGWSAGASSPVDTVAWLTILPDDGPSGGLYRHIPAMR